MNISLELLEKSKLTLEEFFALTLIEEGKDILQFTQYFEEHVLGTLESNLWIKKLDDGSYTLRGKGKEILRPASPVNFDEFWDIFPATTPSGRVLRASAKVWGGKPTRDYEVCKKKYLSKVKTVEAHNQIVTIVKARVDSKDYEYMNNIETYINQEKWQQDAKYLGQVNTTNTINKIVE